MEANQIKELDIITAIIKFSAGVDTYEIRGIKDTDWKLWACYLAIKYSGCPANQIAKYYNIYRPFMLNRVQAMAVQFLIDPDSLETLDTMGQLYKDLNGCKL